MTIQYVCQSCGWEGYEAKGRKCPSCSKEVSKCCVCGVAAYSLDDKKCVECGTEFPKEGKS